MADAPVDHIAVMIVKETSHPFIITCEFMGLPLRWDPPLSTRVRDRRLRLRDIFSRGLGESP